ncbi:MAG: Aerobic respiration control sensor protein ArcB, partial [Pseudomonadota bacterium]
TAFSLWRDRGGAREISRRTFLAVYILFVIVTGLFVYLLPQAQADLHRVILAATSFLLLLVPLGWLRVPKLFTVLMHLVTLTAVLMIGYIAAVSGGIHSPAMVWLSIMAVPVLMLRGPGPALVWIGLIELGTFGMMLATQGGWISGQLNLTKDGVLWALVNNALALVDLMAAIVMYHHLHALQMKELDARNRDLQTTHEALMQAQAHKDEFVAAVGHELRTPMNAILGFNSVLRDELIDTPEQVEVVDHIRRSTEHLLQVVNEILDFSQLQAGKVQAAPHDFDLRAALADEWAQHAQAAHDKGLDLRLLGLDDVPQHVHMDRARLRQVLGLLLDNAIKFTARGHVHVHLSATPQQLRCEVHDSGCGIAPERQAQIFRHFEHADVQTNRTHGGTGLGLAICEQLVGLLGGRIGVHSVPGQGTQFWFELPWQAAHSADAAPDDPQAEHTRQLPLEILVVDDNPVNLKVADMQLRKVWPRARVTTAADAAEALRLLDQQGFDVALVDMVMPVMDGPALTRQIHERFAAITARMPIIALTANTLPQERERCLAAGMSEVLHKPLDTQALLQTVGRQIALHRSPHGLGD